MTAQFNTPQDAEDAYYDAIENSDLEALMQVWQEDANCFCYLPMMPVAFGAEAIRNQWGDLLGNISLDIEIRHLEWIEAGDFAFHLLEEHVKAAGQPAPQVAYATNTYRKNENGWRMVGHQNSPPPPPQFNTPG